MESKDVVIASANAALQTVGTNEFRKLTQYTVKMVGTEIARHVEPTDAPGLFSPTDVELDGNSHDGAILALRDRAVIGWITGRFRIKNFEAVVPTSEIKAIEIGTRAGGAMTKDRKTLMIDAGRTWSLVLPNYATDGERDITIFLKGVLDGAIAPVFESGE